MEKTFWKQSKFWALLLAALLVSALEVLTFFKIGFSYPFSMMFYAALVTIIGWKTLIKGVYALFALNLKSMHLLMLVAVSGAFYLGQYEEAAVVIVLFTLADFLEKVGVEKSKSALSSLLKEMPKKALLAMTEEVVDVDKLKLGERIRVKPGQIIPIDGNVVNGFSLVDESMITGEPIPQDKRLGDPVFAGTLNNQGALDIEVTKIYSDTSLSKIKEMTFQASKYKALSQTFIENFSAVYTPLIILLALIWVLLPVIWGSLDPKKHLYEALTLLVIACPCALVISTPIAIFSAIGNASKKGVLIKGGRFLEALAQLKVLAFDKTRTLTKGKPIVSEIIAFGALTKNELLACAAGIEKLSEHPLADSIVQAAKKENLSLHPVENFESFIGRGARADCMVCYDRHHCIGKLQFILEEHKVPDLVLKEIEKLQAKGLSVIVVSSHRQVKGLIALEDELREESAEIIKRLKKLEITSIMLTGDHELSAKYAAKKLGIDDVYSELLPEDKAGMIRKLMEKHKVIGMIGDGINDGPALATASVGISMAGLGSDTALEASSIVLLNDRLNLIPYLIQLGRRTVSMIRFNVLFAIIFKLAVVILALMGFANLALAILADVGVTLFVTLNSLRLLQDSLSLDPSGDSLVKSTTSNL